MSKECAIVIVKHLQQTEGFSREEAIEVFKEMRDQVREGYDPEELLYEIGLEPDFVLGLL